MLRKLMDSIRGGRSRRREEKAAAERVEKLVRHKCPNLIMTRRHRKLLMEAMDAAISHVSDWMDAIPGPVALEPGHWDSDPVLNGLFVGSDAVRETIENSRSLRSWFKQSNEQSAVALLTAVWREKTAFGTAAEGRIMRRDVLQKSVSFENHQLLVPNASMAAARAELETKLLVALCGQTFAQTQDLKEWREELEAQRELLQFKYRTAGDAAGMRELAETAPEAARVLREINGKLRSIKRDLGTSESNFRYMMGILSRPEDFFHAQRLTLRLSRLGIVVDSSADSTVNEFSLVRYQVGQTSPRAAVWVTVENPSPPGQDGPPG